MNNYATPGYFEQLYASDPDPWKFASSDYERDKYAATLAALPAGHYGRAFEVGCSIGVLTRQLAARCDQIVGVDVAEAALDQARERCADLPGVRFANMAVPNTWPDGMFDLVLFSEVLYYLGIPGIHEAARKTRQCLSPGGVVILVDWHGSTDGACTGDEAATMFIADMAPGLTPVFQTRAEKYRIDVLR